MKFRVYTKAECDNIIALANFTPEEEAAFKMLIKGQTIKEVAYKIGVATRTVDRIIKAIKEKIERI